MLPRRTGRLCVNFLIDTCPCHDNWAFSIINLTVFFSSERRASVASLSTGRRGRSLSDTGGQSLQKDRLIYLAFEVNPIHAIILKD